MFLTLFKQEERMREKQRQRQHIHRGQRTTAEVSSLLPLCGCRNQTQVTRLGSKYPYLLSHPQPEGGHTKNKPICKRNKILKTLTIKFSFYLKEMKN